MFYEASIITADSESEYGTHREIKNIPSREHGKSKYIVR